tara:strand:- start:147 stop:407 length:261 start_codon:yes stop_codon:yes gene_type:complete
VSKNYLNKFDFIFSEIKKIKMKHQNKKNVNMFKILEKDGFTCQGKNKSTMMVFKGSGKVYTVHVGPKSYHPLRRFLKAEYNYDFIF